MRQQREVHGVPGMRRAIDLHTHTCWGSYKQPWLTTHGRGVIIAFWDCILESTRTMKQHSVGHRHVRADHDFPTLQGQDQQWSGVASAVLSLAVHVISGDFMSTYPLPSERVLLCMFCYISSSGVSCIPFLSSYRAVCHSSGPGFSRVPLNSPLNSPLDPMQNRGCCGRLEWPMTARE